MKPLKRKLSQSFNNAIIKYFAYKSKSESDLEHADKIVDAIFDELEKILITKTHTSQKVQYRNSKDLKRFIIENHTVFFRIDLAKEELQVMYFVASKRVKKNLTR